mmetsp:Transcript_50292/g.68402  ORF Transcript_50292/g.68402 Transcript_50292/m.68402 type:complete len:94 (-) Transcript_50292:65-346(-)
MVSFVLTMRTVDDLRLQWLSAAPLLQWKIIESFCPFIVPSHQRAFTSIPTDTEFVTLTEPHQTTSIVKEVHLTSASDVKVMDLTSVTDVKVGL